MLRLVAPLLLALTLACGDSSPGETAGGTTEMPRELGAGEPCDVAADYCKSGLACALNVVSACTHGICTQTCVYSPAGDNSCPSVEGKEARCNPSNDNGPDVCVVLCGGQDNDCPQTLSQKLECYAGSCLVTPDCEMSSG